MTHPAKRKGNGYEEAMEVWLSGDMRAMANGLLACSQEPTKDKPSHS